MRLGLGFHLSHASYMKRDHVWCFCMMLGCTKVCLQAVRKEFKLRIGVKNERTHSISEAGISRKIGQPLK